MWGPGVAAALTSYFCREPIRLNLGLKKPTKIDLIAMVVALAIVMYMQRSNIWGSVFSLIFISSFVLGEELAWRGQLTIILRNLNIYVRASFIGVLWFFWHIPLIAWGQYFESSVGLFEIFNFFAILLFLSFFLDLVTKRTNTVWFALVVHSVHNYYIQISGKDIELDVQTSIFYLLVLFIATFFLNSKYFFKRFKSLNSNVG